MVSVMVTATQSQISIFLANDLKQIILKTMQTIQENTCITFKARSNEANYIAIAAHPKGG